jgi:protein-arginine kinase activator protein McsA
MTDEERQKITELRINGFGYKAIAAAMGLNRNNVRSYCQRHGIGGSSVVVALNLEEQKNSSLICKHCNKKLTQAPRGRVRKFCSETCRRNWWQLHPDKRKPNENAMKKLTCSHCNNEFESYGAAERKYCSHNCYIKSRFWRDEDGV